MNGTVCWYDLVTSALSFTKITKVFLKDKKAIKYLKLLWYFLIDKTKKNIELERRIEKKVIKNLKRN